MKTNLWVIAEKEWRDGWRNRWLLSVTVVFAIIALGITWFGASVQGQQGLVTLDATLASLSSLTVIVIPLIALLIGFDAFVGEQEQGTLLLLMTYPVSRTGWVLGKFLGQCLILTCAVLVGFGGPFIFLAWQQPTADLLPAIGIFLSSALLLGAVFIALAHSVSLLVSEKARAAGLALLAWFFLTLLYDLALLAILVRSAGWMNPLALKVALLANPTDLFRIINLLTLESNGAGVLASLSQMQFGLLLLYALLAGWTALLLGMSTILLKRKRL